MDLVIDRHTVRGWTVITVTGELDLHTAPSLQVEISTAMEEEARFLAVDLTGVGFMDSTALGILVSSSTRARERGGELTLIGVSGSPAKVLSVTGMDEVFPVVAVAGDLPER